MQKRGGSFSVIVPAYRCAPLLQESVQSVLQQTDGDFEVIIIDDCSGDDTWQCIEELALRDQRIRPYRNERNLGTARTRNRGIGLAKGAYLAFLDGDDRWLPDKLARQRRCLEETGCDVCYTGYSFIDAEGQPVRRPYRVPDTRSRVLPAGELCGMFHGGFPGGLPGPGADAGRVCPRGLCVLAGIAAKRGGIPWHFPTSGGIPPAAR